MAFGSNDSELAVLFSDDWMIAVCKPSGLAVHRGWAREDDTALARVRRLLGQRVYPIHRLDRGTSGVLVFARDGETASRMGVAWQAGQVTKRYLALVRGVPPDCGTIDHPIPRQAGGERVAAVTEFRRLRRSSSERCSLVEACPRTGRLHQVRRHLKHISHPLVGDTKYGRGDINRLYRASYGLCRLALHAASVDISHPWSGAALELRAPLTRDLREPFGALGVLDGTE